MRKIVIDKLPRVEGNGGISVTIDGNSVTDVQFMINEGPRLIERLTVGRTPEEDVSIVPRICAICTLSHRNAVLRAMEKALRIKVPPKVHILREIMHLGEIIESHSLHIFILALPDYLGYPNAIAMASKYDFEVKMGLEMKNFGNHIMKAASGRFIHGENPVIGGFGRFPTRKELLWIKSRAFQFMPAARKMGSIFCELDYPDIPEEDTIYACCEPGNNTYGFWGDEILLSTGEKIRRDEYKKLTNEFVVPYSYAKHSKYKGQPYSVGALARVNNLGERLKGEAAKMYKKYFNRRWQKSPFFHNAAQALEILHCLEKIPELIDKILKYPDDPPIVEYTAKEGKGTGLVEAPRGLLIHHYEISNGLVSEVDIITPTAQNAEDIERYCYIAAQELLDAGQENKIRERIDLVVRAFDPCISCSAHMAEVRRAPEGDWKTRLKKISGGDSPIYVGAGNPDHSDDAAGVVLAHKLKRLGIRNMWIEPDREEREKIWKENLAHPIIFLDAVNFHERPGKITLLPLHHILTHGSLSHRLLPFISESATYARLKNAYLLGIQPETIKRGNNISQPVWKAISKILDQIKSIS